MARTTIIPTQEIKATVGSFPVEQGREELCTIITMEIFGCSIAEVARAVNKSIDEVVSVCSSEDYSMIKRKMIETIRRIDRESLSGKVLQEANDAFERMKDMSENAQREDVKFNANKDIMDRALMTSAMSADADELRITVIKRR